jgi:cellobiose-specific phosphotransferase system component IIC
MRGGSTRSVRSKTATNSVVPDQLSWPTPFPAPVQHLTLTSSGTESSIISLISARFAGLVRYPFTLHSDKAAIRETSRDPSQR